MKLSKNQISNILLLVFIGVFMFTPLRTTLQVWVNRFISFSPGIIAEEKRETLDNYNWSLIDLEGNSFNLNKAKGKVVLVNMWATWCPPCIAEMPDLQKLYNEYKDEVVFLFVTNESIDKAQSFLKKEAYDLPVYQARAKAPEMLASNSIPATYLIDKEGAIVINKKGAADWHSEKVKKQITSLLQE